MPMSLGLGLGLPHVGGNPFAAYTANGFAPEVVLDWSQNKAKGVAFSDLVHTRASNATQIASDGTVKWGPHNLALNSATPATQSITVVSGADYTVEMTGSGSITLSGAGTGSVTEGNPVEITASTTSLTLTIVGSVDTMWAYRSDLGGMANNPARNDSYVPTTSAAVYLPRVENHIYSGGAWKKRGLIEPAATNLVSYSAQFDNAAWTKTRASISADATTGPDGQTTAEKLVEDTTATDEHYVRITLPVVDATIHTQSIYAKAAERSWIVLGRNAGGGSDILNGVYFDVTNGVVGTVGPAVDSYAIEDAGNGWYRCSVTAASSGTTWFADFAASDGDNNVRYTGDGTSGIYIYGAQLETGLVPTSVVPTSGSTATRAADDYDGDAADMPFNTTGLSGALHGEISYGDEGAAGQETLFDRRADVNNRITLTLDTDGAKTGTFTLTMVNGGSSASVSTTAELTPGVNKAFKVAWRVTDSDINIALDGTAETAVATAIGIPALGSTDMDIAPTGVLNLERLLIWAVDIEDTGLEETTS